MTLLFDILMEHNILCTYTVLSVSSAAFVFQIHHCNIGSKCCSGNTLINMGGWIYWYLEEKKHFIGRYNNIMRVGHQKIIWETPVFYFRDTPLK